MKTTSILIAALVSAGLMFTACNKGEEPSPSSQAYSDSEVRQPTRGEKPLHEEVVNIRTEKGNLDQAEGNDDRVVVYPGSNVKPKKERDNQRDPDLIDIHAEKEDVNKN